MSFQKLQFMASSLNKGNVLFNSYNGLGTFRASIISIESAAEKCLKQNKDTTRNPVKDNLI